MDFKDWYEKHNEIRLLVREVEVDPIRLKVDFEKLQRQLEQEQREAESRAELVEALVDLGTAFGDFLRCCREAADAEVHISREPDRVKAGMLQIRDEVSRRRAPSIPRALDELKRKMGDVRPVGRGIAQVVKKEIRAALAKHDPPQPMAKARQIAEAGVRTAHIPPLGEPSQSGKPSAGNIRRRAWARLMKEHAGFAELKPEQMAELLVPAEQAELQHLRELARQAREAQRARVKPRKKVREYKKGKGPEPARPEEIKQLAQSSPRVTLADKLANEGYNLVTKQRRQGGRFAEGQVVVDVEPPKRQPKRRRTKPVKRSVFDIINEMEG